MISGHMGHALMPGHALMSAVIMCSAGGRLRCSMVVTGSVSRVRRGVRLAGSKSAVPVGMPVTAERFSPFLGLTERRRAFAGDARLSPASRQGGKGDQ
jgi:hypothetical protein